MSERPVRVLLDDILESVQKARRYVAGLDREAFLSDEKTADAVVRNLEIIGEAAGRLPERFRSQHGEIEWRRIVGLRNRIVHEYFGIDLAIVWEILQHELPELENRVSAIRRSIGT